jgi:hypothetical protein
MAPLLLAPLMDDEIEDAAPIPAMDSCARAAPATTKLAITTDAIPARQLSIQFSFAAQLIVAISNSRSKFEAAQF